ncbi:Uu.00g106780.m01.CDS01 [Anthostomella pinea]|uniref:Uu.00g106780.m01.CDS01 n=1 Tax=Anthostomella pinea TaxID=933095 RepID=A0AAI8YFX9_9PEZI|nr:Uu.00g106780.m01.CDS01 [Anthostomella pinea]
MKSASFAAALLASVAVAQPHGHNRHHHAKRDLVTEWDTVWETATVIVDGTETETIPAAKPTTSDSPGQFLETSSSAPAAEPTVQSVVDTPTYVAAPSSSSSTTSTSTSTPVVEPTTPTAAAPTTPTTTETPTTQAAPTTTETPTQAAPITTETPTTQAAPTTEAAPTTYPTVEAPSSTTTAAGSTSTLAGADKIQYDVKTPSEITYYTVGPGACGYDDSGKDSSENIVAIPHAFWDSISMATSLGVDEPAHPLCNKVISIQSKTGTTTGTIRDRCGGCENMAIDVTSHAFIDLFGSTTSGRNDVTWWINE